MDFSKVNEIWKPVVGYEGKYEVSNLGRVKSMNYRGNTNTIRILKPYTDKTNNKYHKYTLVTKHSIVVTLMAHWLVMEAFVGSRVGKIIDHIDGDCTNNSLSNLRYCTHRENITFDNVKFKKPKSSKYPGVSYNANSNGKKKWRAIIKNNRITYSIGTFATEIEARDAYLSKLKEFIS